MLVKALKGKIHRCRVTHTKIDYPGSIGIDEDMLNAAGILPYEEVLLANVTNGERVETYVIPAPAGSREISILGAAARLFSPGDIIIIMNFAYYSPDEMKNLKPKVLVCDEHNNFSLLSKS
ncbi:MAG: aspartate 1-decarboxylase [Planctomycetales bacterium]|nr:aspartate 1-decarboxylase [Planctomycetales bacterium]